MRNSTPVTADVTAPDRLPATTAPSPGAAQATAWHARRSVRYLLAIIPILALIGLWQLLATAHLTALRYAVPTPGATFSQLTTDLSTQRFYADVGVTMEEFAYGLLIGALSGVVVGAVLGLVRTLHDVTWPTIVFIQAIPKVALAPLMVILFGFGISSKVVMAASISFFPILVGVIGGVRSVRSDEVDLLRSMKASRWQSFVAIRIPRALPSAFGGFQVGALFALMAVVVTEFLGANDGLGYLIQLRSSQLELPGVFDALIILSVIGVAVSLLLSFIANSLSRWEE